MYLPCLKNTAAMTLAPNGTNFEGASSENIPGSMCGSSVGVACRLLRFTLLQIVETVVDWGSRELRI